MIKTLELRTSDFGGGEQWEVKQEGVSDFGFYLSPLLGCLWGVSSALRTLQCLGVFGAVCVRVSGPAQLQGCDFTTFVQPKIAHLAPGSKQ